MTQLVHAVSRVRAMESQLLTSQSVDRMISADSFELAYGVLDDLGYAKEASYFRENGDFEGVLDMGLFSSSEIFRSFGLDDVRKVLTVVWDIQNISLYLKAKEKGETGEGLEKNAMGYGFYSLEDVKNAVFNSTGNSELLSILEKLKGLSGLAQDEVLRNEIFNRAKKATGGNTFLTQYLFRLLTRENVKRDFIMLSAEELLIRYPSVAQIIEKSNKAHSDSEKLSLLENLLDESMVQFLKDSSMGKIDSFEPLFSFFWRKERNSRVIRSVLLAKKANLSANEIKSEFSSFIF